MRSWIRAHRSWNGSGVSETRGSENPVAVFIAATVRRPTSMRMPAITMAGVSTTGLPGVSRHRACWLLTLKLGWVGEVA